MPSDPHRKSARGSSDDPALTARVLKARQQLMAEGSGNLTNRFLRERFNVSLGTIQRIVREAEAEDGK